MSLQRHRAITAEDREAPPLLEFRLLGPLEVLDRGRSLPLGGTMQRLLLARLLLSPGEVISKDRLIDELWNGSPPQSAATILRNCVWRLRKQLGAEQGLLETHQNGYVWRLEPGRLDAEQFRTLLDEGRALLETGNAPAAAETLREALSLWRGPALADLAYQEFAQREAARLEELRLGALEARIEADLALGRQVEVVPELEAACSEHPERERFAAQLMLAFYRSGRQAEALATYHKVHRSLEAELGLSPSRELQELQRSILTQDPSLELLAGPTLAVPGRPRGRRRLIAGVVVLMAVAVTAGLLATRSRDDGSVLPLHGDSVVRIDPATNRVVAAVGIDSGPLAVAVGDGMVWTASVDDRSVTRIDARTDRVLATIHLPARETVNFLAAGPDHSVWISGYEIGIPGRHLWRYNAATGELTRLATPPIVPVDMTMAGGALWLSDYASLKLLQISPATGAVVAAIPRNDAESQFLRAGDGALWYVTGSQVDVYRVGSRTAIPLGHEISDLAVDPGGAWITDPNADTVQRIDLVSRKITETVRVGRTPLAVAVGAGSVWVANSRDGTVTRVDPKTTDVTTIAVGGTPQRIAVGEGGVWVTVSAR